jgi:hypothetical protein
LVSPEYTAVTLCAPTDGKETLAVAVPLAFAVLLPAVPDTEPLPTDLPPSMKETVPVGATPLLCVATEAVKVTDWPMGAVAALLVAVVVVVACVTVTATAGEEVLAVKLLSPA